MKSQISKNFDLKSKLRGLADGGPVAPRPPQLGGGAGIAQRALAGRAGQLAAIDAEISGGAPTPAPAAPPPPPQMPMTRQGGVRGFFGLRDGGSANKEVRLGHGGEVEGPGGPTDDKAGVFKLSDEEYVLPGDTADAIGRENLDAIRLATHKFVDPEKKAGLRGLANGGSPWIVDPDGTVRATGATRAVAPVAPVGGPVAPVQPPIGQRPPINITPPGSMSTPVAQAADAVTDVTAKTPFSRGVSALRGLAPGAAAAGGIAGAAGAIDDIGTGYRDRFAQSVDAGNGVMGNLAADTARTLGSVGDAVTFGLAGRVGRGIDEMGAGGKGFVEGFTGPSDRDQFLTGRMQQTMNPAAPSTAPSTPNVPTSPLALQSDQRSSTPVTPGSTQSRALSANDVPLETQNAAPLVTGPKALGESVLRSAGTNQYQNLGNYGGNADIYGRASDPSRPGRMNDFAGVGAPIASGQDSVVASALRGLGGGASAPGSPAQPGGGLTVFNTGGDRYDRLAKEVTAKYGSKGQGNLAKRLTEIEGLRQNDINSQRQNDTATANNELTNATSRENNTATNRTNLIESLGRLEGNRATLSANAQTAQLKYLQDAQKTAREGEEKGFDRYNGAIDQMFTTVGPDGKQGVDKAEQEKFKAFIQGSDPKAGEKFSSMRPQDQSVLLQRFKTMYDMNKARNDTAGRGSLPSATGGITNQMDLPTDVREATWNDYWNNNLPLKDYLWSNLPGTNKNVVVTESGQPTLISDYATTGGKWDNDKLSIIEQRTKKDKRGSPLRSN